MKWILSIVIMLFAGWMIAGFLMTQTNSANVDLVATDSLQAKQPLLDTSKTDSVKADTNKPDTIVKRPLADSSINTKGINPSEIVAFAKTQIGVPYLYGSTDPARGFDCSGFITYVFKNFGIVVPRSSIDFTNVGNEVSAAQARAGDLILFTGTDSTERVVGHMGIVTENTDSLHFIHSSSGKAKGVTITPLNSYYKSRYVKTIRVFSQSE